MVENEIDRLHRQVDDLTMLVRRMARRLRRFDGDSALASFALDYLRRQDLVAADDVYRSAQVALADGRR